MTNQHEPTLRYFDARGRAQFIRYYLHARGIAFTDERVPLSADFAAWRALQPDATKSGPFRKLPVLHWDGRTIAETLVIAAFIRTANGDAKLLTTKENRRHDMLLSSLFCDVMLPVGTLIWADLAYPGVDIAALARRTLERLTAYLGVLEGTLGEWRWFEAEEKRPVLLADCLLWEELDVVQHVFGEHAGLDALPRLGRWFRETPGRAAFEACLEAAPCQFSGHPNEAAALDVIRESLGGSQ